MKREDWTLLTIAAANGEPLTPVQLQKCLFLLGQEHKRAVGSSFYHFVPYSYGPFARQVYLDAERLAEQGLVSIQRQRWAEYAATPVGMKRATEIEKDAPAEAVTYVRVVVQWARNLSFQALVRYIYAKYPEFRANSVFQG